jgi:hypothetical protein
MSLHQPSSIGQKRCFSSLYDSYFDYPLPLSAAIANQVAVIKDEACD